MAGKPIKYAENVPGFLRGALDKAEEGWHSVKADLDSKAGLITELNTLAETKPLALLQRGSGDWHLWVQANAAKWLTTEDAPDHTLIKFKEPVGNSWDDDYLEKNSGLDFSKGQPLSADEDGRETYKIETLNCMGYFFPCPVSFKKATFEAMAFFKEATFKGEADFREATFEGVADFREATFKGEASFREATFEGVADFREATFEGHYTSQRAAFLGSALWDDSVFTTTVDFSEAQFLAIASFKNCDFKRNADFDHVWFGKTANTPEPAMYNKWPDSIKQAYSAAAVTHESKNIPNFKGADFTTVPNLGFTHVPTPPQPPINDTAPLKIWRRLKRFWGLNQVQHRIDDSEAPSKLRRLGELAARGHHHQAEAQFFRSELLTRRGHEAKKPADIIMINLFELFSGCGLSFQKPIEWLLRLILVCGLCYGMAANDAISFNGYEAAAAVITAALSLWRPRLFIPIFGITLCAAYYFFSDIYSGGFQFGGANVLTWAELGIFTGLNSLPVIGLASNSHANAVTYLFGGAGAMPIGIQILAFLQNLLSAVLLFFALLSIRNYFKLG